MVPMKIHQTSNDSLQWLRQRIGDHLINRRREAEWAAHSPDKNSPYYYYFFYLWSYLKDNVYENNLQTIPELKRAVITRIQLEERVCVIDNFAEIGEWRSMISRGLSTMIH